MWAAMLCNSTSTSITTSSAAPHGHGDDVNEVQVQKYCEEEEKIVSSFESGDDDVAAMATVKIRAEMMRWIL